MNISSKGFLPELSLLVVHEGAADIGKVLYYELAVSGIDESPLQKYRRYIQSSVG